ncbi:MAG: class I SAM-dependent methyltransferase [gamma proteobacterium symbiont of Phacoides pectinatus]
MSDRKQHWEKVYRERSASELSWYQPIPARSLHLIKQSGTPGDAPIIDIGGGCSLLVDHLLARGYRNLSVLDISATALEVTARRLGEAAQRVRWIEADATRFDPGQPIALRHDRAVFHFLTDPSDRAAYLDNLDRHLRPGGALIIAAFAPEGPR